ncbi:hypothetical protein BU16DRAFT_318274 [Lophium mytilinum]|uniref:Ricin B lectin domain-containing protein n=1 Tax=Lophium mytilinum TaxID=390894 RepID=A0A6A6QYP9_9PEZI|nr:hypothetical protein BU16DRAFT_318274 [Lophium mytilinum]
MALNQVDAASSPDSEYATVYTPSTTSRSASDRLDKGDNVQSPLDSSVPSPGSSFLIQSVATGKVITFQQGRIVLGPLGSHSMTRWRCVENKGWLGFQDPASGMFLGYDKNEELCCTASGQNIWENFSVRQKPEGGYLLLMTHYDNWIMLLWNDLRPVGIKVENGSEKLAVVEDWESDSTAWQFVRL